MLERASQGAAEGLWLRADTQDGGRGRLGREWVSPKGNLYASTIVRVRPDDPAPSDITFVAAVSVRAALAEFAPAIPFRLKWPNDLLVGDAKLCGMLLERRDDAVVVGIGINLAGHPEGLDRPVTSIAAQGIVPPHPQAVVEAIAGHFVDYLGKWRMVGIAAILPEWRKYAHEEGTRLTANLPDGQRLVGEYAGLTDDGALKLRLADGSIHAIHAGDIFLI